MKYFYTLILAIFSLGISAQNYSDDMHSAMLSDNPGELFKLVDHTGINGCFEIKRTEHTLLAISIKHERHEIFSALIEKGADINKSCSGKTPLMYAAKYGNLPALKILINKGADQKISNMGQTALDYAIKYKSFNVEEFLENQ